jgi:hypothetical protein
LLFVLTTGVVFSQDEDVQKKADDFDWEGKYQEEKILLDTALIKATRSADRAEVFWRLSRAVLNIADTDLKSNRINADRALKLFEEGEHHADMAISLAPNKPEGYYWKSSNMGLWGQTKGIFDSLGKAGPMNDNLRLALKQDPEFSDAFYVLGELFEKLPGWPISFGNIDYSVSLGRKCIDLMEAQVKAGKKRGLYYGAYIALANHLWIRNWDAKRRQNAQAGQRRELAKQKHYVDKNYFYEGTITLKNMSDREEARKLVQFVVDELGSVTNRTGGQEDDLKEARKKQKEYR